MLNITINFYSLNFLIFKLKLLWSVQDVLLNTERIILKHQEYLVIVGIHSAK